MRPAVDTQVAPVGLGGLWNLVGIEALTLMASLENRGTFPATDVDVEVFLRDGRHVEHRFPRVEPCDFTQLRYTIVVAEIEHPAEEPAGQIDRLVTRYSDARGLVRYQATMTHNDGSQYLGPTPRREFRVLEGP